MKILIGMTRADTLASGSFKHIVQIGERFRNAGCEVGYVIGKTGPVCDFLAAKGFTVFSIPHLERDLSPLKDLRSLLSLLRIMLRFGPDICSWHTCKIGALGRIASAALFKPSYYVPHGIPFFESRFNGGHKKYRFLERLLAYLPSKIVGVCRFDSEQYLKLGLAQRKSITIHNGMPEVLVPVADPVPNREDKCIFVTAARFETQKDYYTLANAVAHLAKTCPGQFELHIYGDGAQEATVRGLFDAIDATVYFKGVVQDLTLVLRHAHVFVLSSHWEGLPRTCIEAMSCKLPVIATDVGGVCELISHGQTGYLVEPMNDAGFANAMANYVTDDAHRKLHGENSFAKFQAEFTLEKMLDKYMRVYLPESRPEARKGPQMVAEVSET